MPRTIRWRARLEETSGHTGLMPIGDLKPRVVWRSKKRFQLRAGGGNALLIKSPHSIPRLLERAQCGLDLLRGQKMYKTFGLFLLGESAYMSHGLDSLLAELPSLDGLPWRDCVGVGPSDPSLAVAGGTTPLTYFR